MTLPTRTWRDAARWREMMKHGADAESVDDYPSAARQYVQLLSDLDGFESDGWIMDLRAKVLGRLGVVYYADGDADGARAATQAALSLCEKLGDTGGARTYLQNLSMLDSAAPSSDGNAARRVRQLVIAAQDLSDDGEFAGSNSLLLDLVQREAAELSAHGLQGKVHGLLGSNYYRLGERERAAEETRAAVRVCEGTNDSAGVWIYSQNLDVITRR
jgi:tetratricopeptide (TPR) repeat protein